MYSHVDQFPIDKALNTIVEEGIAPVYIREYYRRKGIKVLRVDKNLGDLAKSKECDLIDGLGVRWEVKNDKRALADQVRDGQLAWATGNAYIELKSLYESKADMQLRFAGPGFCIAIPALIAAIEGLASLRGGDRLRSEGIPLPLERLEEISEMVIVL